MALFHRRVRAEFAVDVPALRELARSIQSAAANWEAGARQFGVEAAQNILTAADRLGQAGAVAANAMQMHGEALQAGFEQLGLTTLHTWPALTALAALWLGVLGYVSTTQFGIAAADVGGSTLVGLLLLIAHLVPGVALYREIGAVKKERDAFVARVAEAQRERRRGLRRIRTFTATGYNDNTGEPRQANITCARVQQECDVWLTANRNNIDVVDIQLTVDSKNHAGHAWYGACVSVIAVHYYELLPM